MKREELGELHYITPISNVASILTYGILSHHRSKSVKHNSVAMSKIQDLRSKVRVPGGRMLHDYANLYIYARNPMLYLRRSQHTNICVLRLNIALLDLPQAVITDANASSNYVRFSPSPQGLSRIDRAKVFAEY